MIFPDIITKDYLNKLDQTLKLVPLTNDLMFKNLIEKDIDILKPFILKLLYLGLNPNDCNFTFNNTELPLENYKEYHKTVDFNISINENVHVNLELNSSKYEDIELRNLTYIINLLNQALNRGDNIKKLKDKSYIQLNINTKEKKYGNATICLFNKKENKEILKNFVIIHNWYIEYYKELYYKKT